MPDFSRLSQNWIWWSDRSLRDDPSVSADCPDCEIAFRSGFLSVHLRQDDGWWVVDTVDERGQRHDDTARFSDYELAEKFLIWTWASTGRGLHGAPLEGPGLYARGFESGVRAEPIGDGVYRLESPRGGAVLSEPYATIFSHLMDRPVDTIADAGRKGIA